MGATVSTQLRHASLRRFRRGSASSAGGPDETCTNGIGVDYVTLAATWFAAIGTVAAVCVALRQSTRHRRPRAHVWKSVRSGTDIYLLSVHLNNRGVSPFTVESIDFFERDKHHS